jgi:lipoprotein-anchoring transpeptidase ErfK/SrfK
VSALPKASLNNVILCRRSLIVSLPFLAAGCAGSQRLAPILGNDYGPYGVIYDEGIVVPAVDASTVDPNLLRQEVVWHGRERPGSIVVKIPERRLYLVQGNGRAMRYGIGVGRTEALNFRGSATVGRKEKWPQWTPTASMIAAIPRYREYAGGMGGGPDNPLGARALYLYRDGRDTFFRLHGTNEPETIGGAVSSGCIRLFNQDIIDLYNRVPLGTHVTVLQS